MAQQIPSPRGSSGPDGRIGRFNCGIVSTSFTFRGPQKYRFQVPGSPKEMAERGSSFDAGWVAHAAWSQLVERSIRDALGVLRDPAAGAPANETAPGSGSETPDPNDPDEAVQYEVALTPQNVKHTVRGRTAYNALVRTIADKYLGQAYAMDVVITPLEDPSTDTDDFQPER